ncbi:RagB/SusD family nutrient uptake outer membrane protein [Ancylomarina sp. 16SWW S1-10-2]|uniref:RagB/SusD family nutrient uptake outer membrane protein n=1 Tax=Ancylomarina sp. 16SWW S1-10-2 TaxID=2499681 RepID=UPI0012AE6B9A|nr:RagB/SusD family nutrient uptake outer membrane protein [Ancylomarina sp. 16SWW S1-10-2]MRT91411.1 RagB/SusD family nutrient uptake outer membrane protein [Ancylomarina sp. 16SWW S1-10-2]
MKNKYIYALLVPVLLTFFGCEDLDTAPQGEDITTEQKAEVVENDPSKAAAGVNGIFAQFSQYAPNEDVFDRVNHFDIGYPSVMLFSDANGNDVVQEDNGYNWMSGSLEYSDRDYTSRETQIIWNDMYAMISNSNNVIGSIDPATEEPVTQFYLGQGLAARAFSYWVLAQLYQFNYEGNETKPCVPIITAENAEESALLGGAPRSTVEEVYTLMLNDLNSAIALLKSAEENGSVREDKRYVSLAVAYGLRARVNLTMHKYAEAAADASSAIDASDATPASIDEVSDPYFSNLTEHNWMWGIFVAETDDVVSSGIVNWISHMGSFNYGYCWYSGGRQINKKLYNSIASTDIRKGWWVNADTISANLTDAENAFMKDYGYRAYTQVKFAPYKNEIETSTNANDIPLMRIEEMYLIKAEGEAMSGADGKSTLESFVKAFRDPDFVCEGDVQEEVFRQRRIELWGEGMNWFDIMRLNKGVDRRGGGYPNATMVFNIPAGENILLWRIPEAEIQANPVMNESDNNPAAAVPKPVAE